MRVMLMQDSGYIERSVDIGASNIDEAILLSGLLKETNDTHYIYTEFGGLSHLFIPQNNPLARRFVGNDFYQLSTPDVVPKSWAEYIRLNDPR